MWYLCTLIKHLYLQATSLGIFIMIFWFSAFWYYNPVFTRYTCSIVLPYGNLQSIPAEISLSLIKNVSHWLKIYFGKNYELFVGLSFSKNYLSWKNSFCFLWYFPLPFFTAFACSTVFSIVLNCLCLGLWIVSLFPKFLMCFLFVYCPGLLFTMFQKADGNMIHDSILT